jgi:hypothetical protein
MIGGQLKTKVDCIMSTGNSIPHVDLQGFNDFLKSSATKLNKDGLLFFDIRNWDALSGEKPVMHIHNRNPKKMTAEEYRNTFLLFNWHDNGSVTFSFALITDRNGKNESLDIIPVPLYYPLLKKDIIVCLENNGYRLAACFDMDYLWTKALEREKTGTFNVDFENIQWYGILAKYTG